MTNDISTSGGDWRTFLPWLVALAVLCIASLWLRFEHINGTVPYVQHPDERTVSTEGARIVRTGDFRPHNMVYPSLPKYLAASAMYLGFLRQAAKGTMQHVGEIGNADYPYYDTPEVVAFARYLFALLSVVTLVSVGVAAWLLIRRPSALLFAPLVLAASIDFLYYAVTYMNIDNVGTCFVILGVVAVLYGARRPSILYLSVIPGALAGLAASSKYTQGVLLGSVLIAVVLFSQFRQMPVRCFAAILVSAVVFFAVMPYIIPDPASFVRTLEYHAKNYFVGRPGRWAAYEPGFEQLVAYGNYFSSQVGVGGLFLAAVGLIWSAWRDWRRTLAVAAFPVLLILVFATARTHFTRNMLPVLPFIAIFIVAGLYALQQGTAYLMNRLGLTHQGLRNTLALGACGAIAAVLLIVPIRHIPKHFQLPTESRHMAVAWVTENVPTQSTIIAPERLGLDVRPLQREGYRVRVMDFVALDSGEALRAAIDETPGPAVALIPKWGVDSRFEGGTELADRLNLVAAQFEAVESFGSSQLVVNRPRSASWRHNPRFHIVIPVGLGTDEQP